MKLNPDTMPFLRELQANNNREWFIAHKPRWEAVKKDFIAFTQAALDVMVKEDPTISNSKAERCMYRIYRDLRFSLDKRPYKAHVSFYLPTGGVKRTGMPGYFLQIDPGTEGEGCFMGGGIFMPEPKVLDAIRQEIFYNVDEFKAIIAHPNFQKWFSEGFWTTKKLVNVPKGYPADWEDGDLLKYKDYTTMHRFDEALVDGNDLFDYTIQSFQASVPLNKFIQKAMFELI